MIEGFAKIMLSRMPQTSEYLEKLRRDGQLPLGHIETPRHTEPPPVVEQKTVKVKRKNKSTDIPKQDLRPCGCPLISICKCKKALPANQRLPPPPPVLPTVAQPSSTKTIPIHIKTITRKMKKWPDDLSVLVPYRDLIVPLKDVLSKGYRLFRKDQKEFDYEGFNIGECEREIYPSPKTWLSKEVLEEEDKRGTNLIDIVLNIVFLLGVEQGRRAERRDTKPTEALVEVLNAYRETNKNLRFRIDELELLLEARERNPSMTADELKAYIQAGLEERRAKRIEELKSELRMDISRSSFGFNPTKRAKFKELESLARTLNKDVCSMQQWEHILKDKGWTVKEWTDKCTKKKVKTDFS